MNKVQILGIKIDNVTFSEALKLINSFVLLKKPSQVVTVNPEFIMSAQKDEEFKQILNNADLSVADGAGLLFVSRVFLKKTLLERITGIDLVWKITELAEKKGYPIFLLGGEHGSGKNAAKILKEKFPELIISGTFEGFPNLGNDGSRDFRQLRMTDLKPTRDNANFKIVSVVKKSKPKILFVAYGAPKQDKFIARYKKILNVPVSIGVGGSFDFISGKSTRAPKWIRVLWLEWLWRLIKEPWRINRIITATIKFPMAVIKDKLTKHVN